MTLTSNPTLARLSGLLSRVKAQAPYVGWMLFERVWMLASGVLVGFWVVRSLGPEDFGRFSAASSVAAVLAGLSAMGLETVVVRRLTAEKCNPKQILLTAAMLRLAGSLVYTIVCWAAATVLFRKSPDVAVMAALVAGAMVFRVTDVVGLWFQAQNRYGTAARLRILIRIGGDIIRVTLILQHASATWFAIAILLEAMVAAIVFIVSGRQLWSADGAADRQLAVSLFADGRPVMIGVLIAALYARMDQLILYNMGGALENGFYAAAARISEAFNVVLLSIGAVAAAHFGRLASAPQEIVDRELRHYYRSMTLWGLALSATVCLSAGPIVHAVYGASFEPTIAVLRIHAWTFCLVCSSAALEPWFYHHQKLRHFVPKTLLALAFSVPAVLAGTYLAGSAGTAVAVVATYAVSVFATNAILPGARDAFRFQLSAFRKRENAAT